VNAPQLVFHRKREDFGAGIPLFAMMRDETYFLPHFLRHYRRLGVGSFAICADRCGDAFMAMLEAEPDVSILIARDSAYGDAFGLRPSGLPRRLIQAVKEYMSNTLFAGRWHLVCDADEFLVLPPPFDALAAYVGALDAQGLACSFATMVDFYPERLTDRNFGPQTDPFAGAPYFDGGPYYSFDPAAGRMNNLRWGVRGRIWSALLARAPDEARQFIRRHGAYTPAKTFKFPLLRTSAGVQRVGDHNVSPDARVASCCALAHFKFYPGLDEKLATALREKQYFRGSIEYALLDLALRQIADHSLLDAASRRFRGPADLAEAGLFDLPGVPAA